jgi:hypothetical protein
MMAHNTRLRPITCLLGCRRKCVSLKNKFTQKTNSLRPGRRKFIVTNFTILSFKKHQMNFSNISDHEAHKMIIRKVMATVLWLHIPQNFPERENQQNEHLRHRGNHSTTLLRACSNGAVPKQKLDFNTGDDMC